MSGFHPTDAQREAITAEGSALLVSAGAGSGKTKVLTERLMRIVTAPEGAADVDQFLIITFTRAAAAELRGRIMTELSSALAADPGNRRLRAQSALCSRAQIGTIHSFCSSLLREFSQAAGLDPDFKVMDDDRAAAMKRAALERTLELCYENSAEHPGFLELADTVGAGRDDSALAALLLALHARMQCHARPERWAHEQIALLTEERADAGETPWGRELMEQASFTVGYWCRVYERLLQELAPCADLAAKYTDSLAETWDAMRELSRCLGLGWERARACLPIPFPALKALRNPSDPALAKRVKDAKNACKKAMDALAQKLSDPSQKLLADLKLTAPAMSALLELALLFDREYARDKRRASLVDYSDLEHEAARILTDEDGRPSALARQVSLRYREIMVDEYQDVSQVQDEIFFAVSREGKNLFLVGDVKQSIYRFRLADPKIFTKKYEAWAESGAPGRRILLRENFRSHQEILDGANAVFARCMSRELGDVDYDENAALICGNGLSGAEKPELMLLDLPESDGEQAPDALALEAEMVAEKIRALMGSGLTLSGGRPLQYGDIAILLRTSSRSAGVFRRVLTRLGLPVAAGQGGGFYSSVEISAVMSMLAILDDPHQDIPLMAVLRSPAFDFSADELSAIRAEDPNSDYFSALRQRARHDARCAAFLELLSGLRSVAPDLPTAELVWQVIERLDLLPLCSAMSEGSVRRTRLMTLAELATRFEASGYRGLHRFVLWLADQAARENEPSLGAESGSAIHILTVHKSKGLQFPVVFLCDCAHNFNKSDMTERVLIHPELGLGPKVTNLRKHIEYPTLARRAIAARLERETLSEEMRLLYVALTRAEERLYMTAAVKGLQKKLETARSELTDPLEPAKLLKARSMVDWLIPAVLSDGGRTLRMTIHAPEECEAAVDAAAEQGPVEAETLRLLERQLSFRYPHAGAEALPSKLTATELKERGDDAQDDDAASLLPAARRSFRLPDLEGLDRPATGAERGTATHLVLQHIALDRTGSEEEIRAEVARLREAQFLSGREAEAVDLRAIRRLFASPLGQRILHADAVRREFRFSLLCPACELLPTDERDEILLQGAIDCFLEEQGALTIIDYKTDYIADEEALEEKRRRYTPQLQAYAAALSRICGKPVRESVLYFLSVGQERRVPPKKS